jgi:hypothetical protein
MSEVGLKYDDSKLRMDLIPPESQYGLAMVLTYGAAKYSAENWRAGISYKRVYGALQRHLTAWYSGEEVDPESGMSHLWHALFGLAVLSTYEAHSEDYAGFDDRIKHTNIISPEFFKDFISETMEKFKNVSK